MKNEVTMRDRFMIEWTGRTGVIKEIVENGNDDLNRVVGSVEKDKYMPFWYGSVCDRVKDDIKVVFPWINFD